MYKNEWQNCSAHHSSNNKWEEKMKTKKTHTAKRDKTSENHRVNSFPPDGRKSILSTCNVREVKSKEKTLQELTQFNPRSHPRHNVRKDNKTLDTSKISPAANTIN